MDAPVDDDERDMTANYFHVNIPSKSPREALQPLINKYRGLRYVIKPPSENIGEELYLEESEYLRPYEGPEERREESEASDIKALTYRFCVTLKICISGVAGISTLWSRPRSDEMNSLRKERSSWLLWASFWFSWTRRRQR
jgi:hypothetical protein